MRGPLTLGLFPLPLALRSQLEKNEPSSFLWAEEATELIIHYQTGRPSESQVQEQVPI